MRWLFFPENKITLSFFFGALSKVLLPREVGSDSEKKPSSDAERKEHNEQDDEADRQCDWWIGGGGHGFSRTVRPCRIARTEQGSCQLGEVICN